MFYLVSFSTLNKTELIVVLFINVAKVVTGHYTLNLFHANRKKKIQNFLKNTFSEIIGIYELTNISIRFLERLLNQTL